MPSGVSRRRPRRLRPLHDVLAHLADESQQRRDHPGRGRAWRVDSVETSRLSLRFVEQRPAGYGRPFAPG